MGAVSSIGEVLELAIGREIQAAEFFTKLAQRVGDPARRRLLEELADEELEHKARLELEMMKEGLVAKTVGRFVEVEEAAYAAEFEVGPDTDFKDILSMVMQKERRSFRFYAHLAGIVLEEDVHEVLLELAEEESRHMVRFERAYERLTSNET